MIAGIPDRQAFRAPAHTSEGNEEMSHEAAKLLLETTLRHVGEQDTALAAVQRHCAPDEFAAYRRMVGKVMGEMLLEMINPIIDKYPDLKPPQWT